MRSEQLSPWRTLREDIIPALSRQTLHRILTGMMPVTPAMALHLGKFCGNGPTLSLARRTGDAQSVGQDTYPASGVMKSRLEGGQDVQSSQHARMAARTALAGVTFTLPGLPISAFAPIVNVSARAPYPDRYFARSSRYCPISGARASAHVSILERGPFLVTYIRT
jgi:hypothetical protein